MRQVSHRLSPALNALAAALARLDAEQGDIARRNARAAVSKATRRVHDVVDTHYPAPKRKAVVRRTQTARLRRSMKGYREAMDDGWYEWAGLQETRQRAITLAGIQAKVFTRLRTVANVDAYGRRFIERKHQKVLLVPYWVKHAPMEKLLKFKRDVHARRAWEAIHILGNVS